MKSLISLVLTASSQVKFEQLYLSETDEIRLKLRASIAQLLDDLPVLITGHPSDWLLCVLSKFEKPPDETLRVFQSFDRFFTEIEDRVRLTSPSSDGLKMADKRDTADTCLLMLSLFPERLEFRQRRYGAPSPRWYSKIGAMAFSATGHEDVASHFDGWTEFAHQELKIPSI